MSALSRRLQVLLAVSLALNLFFLGATAARFLAPGHFADRRNNGAHTFLQRSGLDEARPEVRELVQQHRNGVRQLMHELESARIEVRDALSAEPFDPARLAVAFESVRTRTAALQQDMQTTMTNVAPQLEPKQRERMAQALWRRGH
jgi:Spy/CpxP family protein refolding chaperone